MYNCIVHHTEKEKPKTKPKTGQSPNAHRQDCVIMSIPVTDVVPQLKIVNYRGVK